MGEDDLDGGSDDVWRYGIDDYRNLSFRIKRLEEVVALQKCVVEENIQLRTCSHVSFVSMYKVSRCKKCSSSAFTHLISCWGICNNDKFVQPFVFKRL